VHLSRLAEDLIVFGTEEFAFVELDDRVATGSSLMPQKKNPDPLELIRGKAGRLVGRLAGWLTTMKGLPSGYNKDLQEDKEAVFEADDTLDACLRAATTVVATLAMRLDRAARAAGGFMLATDVADFLVARGLPFRAAHELVGRIVRDALAAGRDLKSLSVVEWQAYSPLFDQDVRDAITPGASVRARRTPQSTGPDHVAAATAELRAWVEGASPKT
jgi:argininosuccinate lyase